MAESVLNRLTSSRVLARNTLYSLVGQGAPLLVAIFAIPLLIQGLGTDRFGLLTIAWMVISYFSLFDLGLGRALTQLVAEKLGAGEDREVPALVWTSLFLMSVMGLVGALVVGLLSPLLVHTVLKIPQGIQGETLQSFYLLAIAIPIVTSTAGLRGILEAHQRFDLVNAVRIPMGLAMFLGPLLVLPFFPKNLLAVVAVLALVRLLVWLAYLLLCFHVMPALRQQILFEPAAIGPLLRFGSWMTVSNLIDPFMVYLDRFLVGAVISVTAVAYYTTPYEVVTKLWLIPGALVGVLFPAFATSFIQNRNRAAQLFNLGTKYVFLVLFPMILIIVTLAHEGLDLWIGNEFAQNSTPVLQCLAIGVFINSLAFVPFALVQGAGRPDLTAKMHMIELPFYLVTAWWLIHAYNIKGAAIAWTLRLLVDAVILFTLAQLILPKSRATIRRMALPVGIGLCILALATLLTGTAMKILFLVGILATFALVAWNLILSLEERIKLKNQIKLIHIFNH